MKIAIVGGAASGVISAIALMRELKEEADLTFYEPSDRLGSGLAFGTSKLSHLLNVPTSRMSALADQSEDFTNWLKENSPEALESLHFPFVPRVLYHQYLQFALVRAERESGRKIKWIRSKVNEIEPGAGGWILNSDPAQVDTFSAVLVCTGYRSMIDSAFMGVEPSAGNLVFDAYSDLPTPDPERPIALAGAGLSAIDHWRHLRHAGFRGKFYFISRRGLLPLAHSRGTTVPTVNVESLDFSSVRGLFRGARLLQSEQDLEWLALADSLRPRVQRIWSGWDQRSRSSFLRHVKPYWELIRHRVPATVFEELQSEIKSGQVEVHRARISSVKSSHKGLCVSARNADGSLELDVSFLINATGARVESQFLHVTGPRIYRIGPAAKAEQWEITAIPEIARQTATVAAEIRSSPMLVPVHTEL